MGNHSRGSGLPENRALPAGNPRDRRQSRQARGHVAEHPRSHLQIDFCLQIDPGDTLVSRPIRVTLLDALPTITIMNASRSTVLAARRVDSQGIRMTSTPLSRENNTESVKPVNSATRVATASFIGTAIEFYDFYVYA
ncbi:Major facilitator family transporter, partial [Pseudomonas amygdali pv. lachrymans]